MLYEQLLYILAAHVDDSILVGKVNKFISNFKAAQSKRLEIDDLGPTTWLLGCRRTLHLSQDHYISEIIEEFGVSSSTFVGTPIVAKLVVDAKGDELLNKKLFQFSLLIGKLLYYSHCTRPNINASTCIPPRCNTDNKLSAS